MLPILVKVAQQWPLVRVRVQPHKAMGQWLLVDPPVKTVKVRIQWPLARVRV